MIKHIDEFYEVCRQPNIYTIQDAAEKSGLTFDQIKNLLTKKQLSECKFNFALKISKAIAHEKITQEKAKELFSQNGYNFTGIKKPLF